MKRSNDEWAPKILTLFLIYRFCIDCGELQRRDHSFIRLNRYWLTPQYGNVWDYFFTELDNRSWIVQLIWGLMSDMSFLTILSMVSISVPGLAKVIQGALISFICMDLLATDRWLMPLIFPEDNFPSEEPSIEDEALNAFFDENGFSTRTLLKNLGSTFVYLVILCIILLFIPLMKLLSPHS